MNVSSEPEVEQIQKPKLVRKEGGIGNALHVTG